MRIGNVWRGGRTSMDWSSQNDSGNGHHASVRPLNCHSMGEPWREKLDEWIYCMYGVKREGERERERGYLAVCWLCCCGDGVNMSLASTTLFCIVEVVSVALLLPPAAVDDSGGRKSTPTPLPPVAISTSKR